LDLPCGKVAKICKLCCTYSGLSPFQIALDAIEVNKNPLTGLLPLNSNSSGRRCCQVSLVALGSTISATYQFRSCFNFRDVTSDLNGILPCHEVPALPDSLTEKITYGKLRFLLEVMTMPNVQILTLSSPKSFRAQCIGRIAAQSMPPPSESEMDGRKPRPATPLQYESMCVKRVWIYLTLESCGTTFIAMCRPPTSGILTIFRAPVIESAAGWERPCPRTGESWNRDSMKVSFKRPSQMSLSEHDHVIEACSANASNERSANACQDFSPQ